MRAFACTCGGRVFFDNFRCTRCQAELGFFPEENRLFALSAAAEEGVYLAPNGTRARKCDRYDALGLCNWMVLESDDHARCRACRLNVDEPADPTPDEREALRVLESAKRRLLYSLARLGLSVVSKEEDPNGLGFSIAASTPEEKVWMGHAGGLITLDLAEANPLHRESTRLALGESYRTVLGHFRHESGHYFWDRLVRDRPIVEEYRRLFGDERADYATALARHYESPLKFDADQFITRYAGSHPWEDFAETWAHYLHCTDLWETAESFGVGIPEPVMEPAASEFDGRLARWCELSIALNAMNRSMGHPDAYPFAIGPVVARKLEFVERLIESARHADPVPDAPRPDETTDEEPPQSTSTSPGGSAANQPAISFATSGMG